MRQDMDKEHIDLDPTGCQNLCNAVVILAAKDYRKALKTLKKNPHSTKAKSDKDELERFFRSNLYRLYTDVDGEFLIRKLNEEVSG